MCVCERERERKRERERGGGGGGRMENKLFITSLTSIHTQGTKLWIIMEYLGGGSALDLVSHSYPA